MIGHALQIATKGILGSLSTLGYIIGFTVVESVPPETPPVVDIPYVAVGGGSGGGPSVLHAKPAKKKVIRITFWHDGEVYEQINTVDENLEITLSDLTLIDGPGEKPTVALKSFSKVI